MDRWRALYQLIRAYVWSLTIVGFLTVVLLLVPRGVPDPQLAGTWFALGGFGSLLVLTLLMAFLLRNP